MQWSNQPASPWRFVCAAAVVSFGVLAITSCDDKKPQTQPERPAQTAPPPAPLKPIDPLAGLSVDELGPYFRDQRVDLAAKDADARLKAAVARFPVKDAVVPLRTERNAKTQDVALVAYALGEAGAAQVDLSIPARDGKLAVLRIVPERRLGMQVPECAVIAMIKKDNTSAVWQKKGGTATRFLKGLAGPDLSMTVEGLVERAKGCPSPIWFLAGEMGVTWGLVADLGLRALGATDPPLRPTQIGLLRDAPTAGRPVSLETDKRTPPR